jgi:hypothetical protein
MCRIILKIERFEPHERVDDAPAPKRRFVIADAELLPQGCGRDLWGRYVTADAEPEPVADPAPVPAEARLVRELQASTDQMLLSASIPWRTVQQAAHELGLSYPAFGQRLRRHPPPPEIAHKNKITNQWRIDVSALRMWWAKQFGWSPSR